MTSQAQIRAEITLLLKGRDAFWRDVRAITGTDRLLSSISSQAAVQPREVAQALQQQGRRHLELAVSNGLTERNLPQRAARARVVRHCE